MASISTDTTNNAIGVAKDQVLGTLLDLINNPDLSSGQKSAALLKAQADSGVIDGTINVLGKTYNKFGQTGQ